MVEPNPEIVIIGAGPVGLFTAVQIKILIPHINLVVYEKYTEYQRKHVLRLSKLTTFFGLPPHPLLTNMIDDLPSVVRTSVLETQLLEITKQLQIPIIYKNITNLDEFSNSRIIIGADGAHSMVRRLVFDNEMKVQQVLKYIVEIKYEVYGQGQKLDYLNYQYRTQKTMKYLADEHIGTQKDNRTPITLHLLVDEETYEHMKAATFKEPYYLHTHQHLIPDDLLETITIWLNVKQEYANEKRVENSEKITCITLAVYQSANVVKYDEKKEQYTCLVGDAAFGVPFFRSLNNGIICSRKLALCIKLCCDGDDPSETAGGGILANLTFAWSTVVNQVHSLFSFNEPLTAYNDFVDMLATKEILVAQNKAMLLFVAEVVNTINGTVPWQVNKWSPEEIEHFKQKIDDTNNSILPTADEVHLNTATDEINDEEDDDLVQEFEPIPAK